jgi:hypothetical protein
MAAQVQVRLRDGTLLEDIASIALDKRLTRRLNRPASFSCRVPSYLVNEIQADGRPLICSGYRQICVILDATDPDPFFHGILWNVEDDGDEDMCYSSITAWDPMVVWRYRPARDLIDSYSGSAGNFSDPSFINRNQTGPQIMEEILNASELAVGDDPADGEGQTFIDLALSSFAVGGQDLRGAPTNWPMTIAEIATLLTNTGELDNVLTPIIGGVGVDGFQNMATIACYNGDYGTDLSGSVNLDYAVGDNNARLMRRTDNMDTIANKNWYYLGPRLDQQHWRSNIAPVIGTLGALGTFIQSSRDDLGVFMQIPIYDNFGTETSARLLYVQSWLTESLIRAKPRELVYLTPDRDSPGSAVVGAFDIGDIIAVNVGTRARVVSSGVQRIYGYQIDIDDDAVEALGELVVSPDQDSI